MRYDPGVTTEAIPQANPSSDRDAMDAKYRRWRRQTFVITWLAYAGFYLTRKSFAVAKIGIQHDPSIRMSDATMGWIDFCNLGAYAIGQLLFGVLGDKAGPRRIVLAGMFGSVLVAAATGASQMAILMGALLCVQGLLQSTGWAPLTKNVSCFFSRRERGTVMGLWCTNYPVGGLLALILAGWAGDHWGWRYTFYAPAAVLLVVAILFVFLQRNKPEDVGLPSIEEHHGEPQAVLVAGESPADEPEGSWKTIREALTNRMVLLLAAVYFLIKPTRYALLAWGPKYINMRLNTGMTQSALVSAMFELAGAPGALLAGYISDRFLASRRVPVCVVSLMLLAAALFVLDRLKADRWVLGTALFAVGFLLFAADSLVAGACAVDFGTKKGASTAAGIINAVGSIGGMIGGSVMGFVAAKWVFMCLGTASLLAGLLLLPQWNAMPATAKK